MLSKLLEGNRRKRSAYDPPEPVKEITKEIQKKYDHCYELRHKPFREFNDMSASSRATLDQKTWNVFEDAPSQDPDESWRYNGRKSNSRNKVISTAAHIVSSLMIPGVFAQDEFDNEDKFAALAMRDMLLWNIDHSEYEMANLFGTIAACVNPVAYISVQTALAFQNIRKQYEDGNVSIEEVIDEVFSGLQVDPIPWDEIYIPNYYQYSHQKQQYRIRRRLIGYDEAYSRYGKNPNFTLVDPGKNTVFSSRDRKFYDVQDPQRKHLCEELVYASRIDDLEIPYVSGIYMGHENVERNRMKHRNNTDRPLYPEAKFGYEPIDEKRFYYYKSLVFKLWPDQRKIDRMNRIAVDGATILAIPPVATSGPGSVDASIIYPGGSFSFPKETTINPIKTGMDLSAVHKEIAESERAMAESSQDSIRQGQASDVKRTAFEISRIEQNAIIKEFAIFGRMVANMVEQLGGFMVNDIIRHQTVLEMKEVTPGIFRMEDKQFLLQGQTEEGRQVSKKLIFTDEFMGQFLTETERKTISYQMFEEEEKNGATKIAKINPHKFARLKYTLNIEPDSAVPQTLAFREERSLRNYSLMMKDPFSDKEAVARDFLYDPLTNGNSDKYMVKAAELGIDRRRVGAEEEEATPPEGETDGGGFLPADNRAPAGIIGSR